MSKEKQVKEPKVVKTYKRSEVAIAITKFVVTLAIGITIGVYATNWFHTTINDSVVKQVSQLK